MLTLIGYWENDFEKHWIHPEILVKPGWEVQDRAAIVSYLKSGVKLNEDLGYSTCRFPGGPPDEEMGCGEQSDGTWIWPEALWVYVEKYHVRLPDKFVSHMRRHQFKISPALCYEDVVNLRMDTDYWKAWCEEQRNRARQT